MKFFLFYLSLTLPFTSYAQTPASAEIQTHGTCDTDILCATQRDNKEREEVVKQQRQEEEEFRQRQNRMQNEQVRQLELQNNLIEKQIEQGKENNKSEEVVR